MLTPLTIVPFAQNGNEAARLIDVTGAGVASVLEPTSAIEPDVFRAAVVSAALDPPGIAGVLFTARWGGGGVMLT